ILIKQVLNASGGSDAIKVASNFFLQILTPNGGAITPQFAGSESGTLFELPRGGAYKVVENTNPAPTYALSLSPDCVGTILAGDVKTCTVTNDDHPAPLRTLKTDINNDSGSKNAGHFDITVTSKGTALPSFPGSASGTDVTVSAGTYSVDEATVPGYTKTSAVGCSGTLALAETKTCTITNDDNVTPMATLRVIKQVVNDNGGTALAGAWQMTVTNNGSPMTPFPGSAAGTNVTLSVGSYSVAESGGPAGYTPSLSAACSGTIAASETKTCTITNDDQPAHLTVIKQVINNNGGTKTPSDFSITVTTNGTPMTPFPGSAAGTDVSL